jgi:hypothetical protein
MKKITLLLFSATLLFSCSSDNTNVDDTTPSNPQSSNPQNQGKIKKIEELQNGIVIKTSDYQYNEVGNISKLTIDDRTKVYETTFKYDANNTMISWNLLEYYSFDSSRKIEQTNTLEYQNGKIVNICIDRNNKIFSTPSHEMDRISYSYIGIYPSTIQHYNPKRFEFNIAPTCADVTTTSNDEYFEYTNGNATMYDAGQSAFSNVFYKIEYDTKKHYQSTIKPDAFRNILGRSTQNNFTKFYEYDKTTDVLKATIVFENTYNSNDFITKAVEKYYKTGSTQPSNTTTINYLYY